jgi:hypothetical protein
METTVITRRDFLRVAAGTAVAATLGGAVIEEARSEATARVVLIRHADAVGNEGNIQGEIVQSMLDDAVKTLLGTGDPLEGWRRLIKNTDIVGIKSNSWGKLPTPR